MSAGKYKGSPVFLMRLWGEDDRDAASAGTSGSVGSDGTAERKWRGKLLHMGTGEALYFHGWPDLLSILDSLLTREDAENQPSSTGLTHEDSAH